MGDEIQPVTAGSGADVKTNAEVGNGNDNNDELTLRSECRNWTGAQYKADYPTVLDARRFSAMFSDDRIKAMFDRRST